MPSFPSVGFSHGAKAYSHLLERWRRSRTSSTDGPGRPWDEGRPQRHWARYYQPVQSNLESARALLFVTSYSVNNVLARNT
jgi:hypothetical protein